MSTHIVPSSIPVKLSSEYIELLTVKFLPRALNVARRLAKHYDYPDVEEFESLALYTLSTSLSAYTFKPDEKLVWLICWRRITAALRREAEVFRARHG